MKRELYAYGPITIAISVADLRERLPSVLRERLLKDSVLRDGIYVDADDVELIAEIDRLLRVGQTREVMRYLIAEVDRASVNEYQYYLVGFPLLTSTSKSDDVLNARSAEEYLTGIDFRWPATPSVCVREMPGLLFMMERIILVTSQVKELFEGSAVTGARYTAVRDNCWRMEVLPQVPERADDINLRKDDYDPQTRSIVQTSKFGLRYEISDFGPEDLQMIDRVEVGNTSYRYRHPWLVVSRRVVELCLAHKVDRMQFPNFLFKRGLVPVLVGRGRITSTLQEFA